MMQNVLQRLQLYAREYNHVFLSHKNNRSSGLEKVKFCSELAVSFSIEAVKCIVQ